MNKYSGKVSKLEILILGFSDFIILNTFKTTIYHCDTDKINILTRHLTNKINEISDLFNPLKVRNVWSDTARNL